MANFLDITPFQEAASRVRVRIGQIAFANWLKKSHWIAGCGALAAVVALRHFADWRSGEVWVVSGLIFTWLIAGWIISLAARPAPLRALAIFDRNGNWKDRFSSAFFFLQDGKKSKDLCEGEKLHVTRAHQELRNALGSLPQSLPMPALSKVWILPALALAFAFTPFLRKGIQPGDSLLSEEMIRSAALEAEHIRRATRDLDGLESLTAGERDELEKLESSVEAAAGEISEPEGQTARQVLSTLESRARAAERLAERLGLHDDAWASEELLRELSQHADTADLAVGIRDKNPRLVADESEKIAGILKNDDIKRETADRFTIALERSASKASDEDATRPVGERIGNASRKMTARQPKTAAREFEELAKHFRQAEQRQVAQKKLLKLAEQLRNSGSQISGSKLESMKKIADAPKRLPEGLQPIEAMPLARQLQNLMAPQIPQPGPGNAVPMPIPGSLGQGPKGNGPNNGKDQENQPGAMTPIPGQAPGQGHGEKGKGIAGAGTGKNRDGQPNRQNGQGGLLNAPIPGTAPDSQLLGSNLGNGSSSGSGTSSGAGGGNEAGSATMDMFEQRSEIAKAQRESRVAAALNKEGDSQFRSVDGKGSRTEKARRGRKEIVTDFIDVEEAALEERTLPLSRRRQVLRYFSEIRRQLETKE